jgi:hypothetical protein
LDNRQQQAAAQRLHNSPASAASCSAGALSPASSLSASSKGSTGSLLARRSSRLLAGYCELACGLPVRTDLGALSGGSNVSDSSLLGPAVSTATGARPAGQQSSEDASVRGMPLGHGLLPGSK